MNIVTTEIEDVLLICPQRYGDDRGWFTESWNETRARDAGIDIHWVQDNHSYSAQKGTLRGLHFQSPPHAQDKLVRCTRGAILDVAVDFRAGSPTYGHHVKRELTAQNGHQLLVPVGFLHGFVTLCDDTEVQYKCSDFYAPECDGAVRFDDPNLCIDWGLDALGIKNPTLSAKDEAAPFLSDIVSPFNWEINK